jgi:signal transduction histidine kinase
MSGSNLTITVRAMKALRSAIARLRQVNPRVWDAVFGVAFVVFGLVALASGSPKGIAGFRDTDAIAVALTVLACAPIATRRLWPLASLLVSIAAVLTLTAADYRSGTTPTTLLFLLYAAAAYATPTRSQLALGTATLALAFAAISDPPDMAGADVFVTLAFFVGSWTFGTVLRNRRETLMGRVAEAEQRAEIESERGARAVAEERLRIAQELHDVVAHSMSVIVVQAGVGAHVIDKSPDEARRALDAIAATGRTTLTEMRRLLGVLRAEDGSRGYAPAPGLDDVAALADLVRSAGLTVELRIDGDPATAPPGVSLSAYRIVQEALTNVLKHAGPATAHVSVCVETGAVAVEIVDDGRGLAAKPHDAHPAGGHGLVGTLHTGGRPGGGFVVRARIPYEVAP